MPAITSRPARIHALSAGTGGADGSVALTSAVVKGSETGDVGGASDTTASIVN
jgi:hypothetical protein